MAPVWYWRTQWRKPSASGSRRKKAWYRRATESVMAGHDDGSDWAAAGAGATMADPPTRAAASRQRPRPRAAAASAGGGSATAPSPFAGHRVGHGWSPVAAGRSGSDDQADQEPT